MFANNYGHMLRFHLVWRDVSAHVSIPLILGSLRTLKHSRDESIVLVSCKHDHILTFAACGRDVIWRVMIAICSSSTCFWLKIAMRRRLWEIMLSWHRLDWKTLRKDACRKNACRSRNSGDKGTYKTSDSGNDEREEIVWKRVIWGVK